MNPAAPRTEAPDPPTSERERIANLIAQFVADLHTADEMPDLILGTLDAPRAEAPDLRAAAEAFVALHQPDGECNGKCSAWARLRTALSTATPAPLDDRIRQFLWANHGHGAHLYGDDGEMQCRACLPEWDYRRMPLATAVAVAERALAPRLTEAGS
jgi:hypothetical protein